MKLCVLWKTKYNRQQEGDKYDKTIITCWNVTVNES